LQQTARGDHRPQQNVYVIGHYNESSELVVTRVWETTVQMPGHKEPFALRASMRQTGKLHTYTVAALAGNSSTPKHQAQFSAWQIRATFSPALLT
jgi:hypothetical protein